MEGNVISETIHPTLEELEKRILEEEKRRKEFDKEYNRLIAERDKLKRSISIRSLYARMLATIGLCRKSERDKLLARVKQLEKERDSESALRVTEMKRLKMNMAAVAQQKEDMKELAENWKQIKAKYEEYLELDSQGKVERPKKK